MTSSMGCQPARPSTSAVYTEAVERGDYSAAVQAQCEGCPTCDTEDRLPSRELLDELAADQRHPKHQVPSARADRP